MPTPPAGLTPSDYAQLLRNQQAEIDRLRAALDKLRLHQPSIRTMRHNLLRIEWWEFRRRRNIQFQLAHLAMALADDAPHLVEFHPAASAVRLHNQPEDDNAGAYSDDSGLLRFSDLPRIGGSQAE